MTTPIIAEKDGSYWVKHKGKFIYEIAPVEQFDKEEWAIVDEYSKRFQKLSGFRFAFEDKKRGVKLDVVVSFHVSSNKIYNNISFGSIKFLDPALKWVSTDVLESSYNHKWVTEREDYKNHLSLLRELIREINSLPKKIKDKIYQFYDEAYYS